jgi:hypothetical protein
MDSRDWYALGYDGRRASLDKVFDGQATPDVALLTMFDWVGHEGPVGVTKEGELYHPEITTSRRLLPANITNLAVRDVSFSGNHVRLAYRWEYMFREKTIEVATSTETDSGFPYCEDPIWMPTSTGPALHRKFRAIAAGSRFGLTLVTKKNWCFQFQLDDGELRLNDSGHAMTGYESQVHSFEHVIQPGSPTYRLAYAEWPNGSRAYMDSRGLLHLRSAVASRPEVSLVLHAPEVTGWCSDGRRWGNEYFIGAEATATAEEIFHDVILPFIHDLR